MKRFILGLVALLALSAPAMADTLQLAVVASGCAGQSYTAGFPRPLVATTTGDLCVKGTLAAGSAVIGKVGIDQTTPGTTNAVSVTNLPSTVSVNTGATGASSPRVTIAVDSATVGGSAALPAGSAIIGNVRIDQTTPGTTNGISLAQIGAVTVSSGAGATGTGTQRVGVAQDITTVAGSAPGTAGSASANVLSVQGVASMTPLQVSQGAAATGGYSYTNVAAGQATTVIKASAGTLHSITLNSAATATNTTVIYDHASGAGTVIARPNVVAATVPTTLIFDIAFATGLTIITANANGGDMTVTWK